MTASSEGNYAPVGKRAAAIAYAYTIANTYTIVYDLFYDVRDARSQADAYAKIYANASAIANIYTDSPFDSYPEVYDIRQDYISANNTNSIKDAIANTISHFRHLKKLNIFKNVNLTKLIENLKKLESRVPSNQNSIEEHRAFVQSFKALIPTFKEEWFHALNLTSNQVHRVVESEDRYFRFFKIPLAYTENPVSFFRNLRQRLAAQDRELSHSYRSIQQYSPHQSVTPINLSLEEAKALADYLYANSLIIQCNKAAVQVSPETWKEIEAKMLLPPNN